MICPHGCPHRPSKLTVRHPAPPSATRCHPANYKSARPFLPTISEHFVAFNRPACKWHLLLHTQEVAGSSPAAPTILQQASREGRAASASLSRCSTCRPRTLDSISILAFQHRRPPAPRHGLPRVCPSGRYCPLGMRTRRSDPASAARGSSGSMVSSRSPGH